MWYITLIEVENESFILNGTNADILNLFQLEPKVKTDWGLVGDINNETNKNPHLKLLVHEWSPQSPAWTYNKQLNWTISTEAENSHQMLIAQSALASHDH